MWRLISFLLKVVLLCLALATLWWQEQRIEQLEEQVECLKDYAHCVAPVFKMNPPRNT